MLGTSEVRELKGRENPINVAGGPASHATAFAMKRFAARYAADGGGAVKWRTEYGVRGAGGMEVHPSRRTFSWWFVGALAGGVRRGGTKY